MVEWQLVGRQIGRRATGRQNWPTMFLSIFLLEFDFVLSTNYTAGQLSVGQLPPTARNWSVMVTNIICSRRQY